MSNNEDTKRDLERFFLEGSRVCSWASGAKKTVISSGRKWICYKRGGLCLVDVFGTDNGKDRGEFEGITTIRHNDKEIWRMIYNGAYTEDSLACLRAALLEAYGGNGIFHDGRGPKEFHHGTMIYRNTPEQGSTFKSFKGCEIIQCSDTGRVGGYARYEGGLVAQP